MIETFMYLLVPLALLALGFSVGRINEKRHFASIREREGRFAHIPVTTWDTVDWPDNVDRAQLVTGSIVVSIDYFKRFIASIRTLLGGEVKAYSPLLDRGRREAILRMKEQLPGADAYLNLRIETSNIAATMPGDKNTVGGVEIIAYGTAVIYRR